MYEFPTWNQSNFQRVEEFFYVSEYFSDKELPNKVEEKRLENYLSSFKKPSVMEATSS